MRILCAADAQFCSGGGGTLSADVIVSALRWSRAVHAVAQCCVYHAQKNDALILASKRSQRHAAYWKSI
jgi:hypothetical protein